jgi:hypothetical protein
MVYRGVSSILGWSYTTTTNAGRYAPQESLCIMKIDKKAVMSASKEVGVAEYQVFDSVQEARDLLGDVTVLAYCNAMSRTNAMNKVRANATGIPSRQWFADEVLSTRFEEFRPVMGDRNRFAELRDKLVEEARAAWLLAHPAAAAAATATNDD